MDGLVWCGVSALWCLACGVQGSLALVHRLHCVGAWCLCFACLRCAVSVAPWRSFIVRVLTPCLCCSMGDQDKSRLYSAPQRRLHCRRYGLYTSSQRWFDDRWSWYKQEIALEV